MVAADYQAWSDGELARGVLRDADGVGRRDRAALVHRQPADDGRRPRGAIVDQPRTGRLEAMPMADDTTVADLVIAGARCVATMDAERRELAGGWVGDHRRAGRRRRHRVAAAGGRPARRHRLPRHAGARQHPPPPVPEPDPGYPPMTDKPLFGWLQSLYPLWRRSTPRRPTSRRGSAWPSWRCRAARRRPTTSTSTRAAPATCSRRDRGGARPRHAVPPDARVDVAVGEGRWLPPDDVVADDDEILAASEEAVAPPPRPRARRDGADRARAVLAVHRHRGADGPVGGAGRALDVRLHTHFAENAEDDEFSLATFGCRPIEYLERTGWLTDRAWLAHCVMPNDDEVRRLGAAGVGVAHCPSSNLILSSGIAPVVALRAAGVPVGLGVDGSSSADAASLWLEARQAMLLAKLRDGAGARTARMALEMATLGGAAASGGRASSAC